MPLNIKNHIIFIFIICSYCCVTTAKKKDILKAAQELLDKEIPRCQSECTSTKLTQNILDDLRIRGKAQKAVCCHIKSLQENPSSSSWVWSSLGHLYTGQATKSSATTSFKQAAKLSGKLSGHVTDWHFLGPFVIGKIEVDGDPTELYGGIRNVSKERFKKNTKYVSELAEKGEISWKIFKQLKKGDNVQIVPEVNWNDLVRSLGSMGITEWQGWLVGEFAVNDNGVNVIIQCHGVHTVYVDDIPITGDVYRRQELWFSVPLSKGIHTLYIRVRAAPNAAIKCDIEPAKSAFEILKPHFQPDLFDGYLFSSLLPLPISNLHSTKWLRINHVSIQEQSLGNQLGVKVVDDIKTGIAPGQTKPIHLQFSAENDRILDNCDDIIVKLKISTSDGSIVYPLTIRCRKRHESFLFTFLDHDGSVQHAAAIEPLEEWDVDPILLTMHGTTVPPQNQADSYKHMENGQFVFGLERAWLVAPTRHGAHNWEGPGALTAVAATDALQELVHDKTWITCKASAQHLIVAGHSMGGHGAWHVATHFPDRILALLPLAGWIKKEEYGDSNLFFKHDISTSSVDPSVKAIMEACIAENDADRHVSNLKGISVLARIGGSDRTIHPYFMRRMWRLLKQYDIDVTYVELPGLEHWWWDTQTTNDGGCVNDKQLRDFTNAHAVMPGSCDSEDGSCDENIENRYKAPSEESFTYTVINPAFGGPMRGLQIVYQHTPFRTASIQVTCQQSDCSLATTNVIQFSVQEPELRPMHWNIRNVKVDSQDVTFTGASADKPVKFCKTKDGSWEECSSDPEISRTPQQAGPARRVAEAPFLIVTGTQGDSSSLLLPLAVYISNLFYITSDTYAQVVKDSDVDDNMKEKYNLIVLGGPQENRLTADLIKTVPVDIGKGLSIGSCNFTDPSTGALFLVPNGAERLALLMMGNSHEGLQDVVQMAAPTIPPMTRSPFSNLVPDYVITGPAFRSNGPGGYLCAGFWDHTWQQTPQLSSCSYCVKGH